MIDVAHTFRGFDDVSERVLRLVSEASQPAE